MKKIIILTLVLLSLTGCFDYKEVNELAIISGIGIDYKDDAYVITLEVLDDEGNKQSSKMKSYTVSGKHKDLSMAISNTASILSKRAFFAHTKLLVISEDVARDKLSSIYDYFLRNTYIHENVYMVITGNPEGLLSSTNELQETPSLEIVSLLKNVELYNNSSVLKTIDEVINEDISFGKDICLSEIIYNSENKLFEINGLAIFSKGSYQTTLSDNEAMYFNILNNNVKRSIFYVEMDDMDFAVALQNPSVDINVLSNKIEVNVSLKANIFDNPSNIEIGNTDNLEKINKLLSDKLSREIKVFIEVLQDNKSDILFLADNYYKKTKEKYEDLWINADIDIKTEITINKKGLTFEVEHD